jgi:hypothetical protein
LNNGMGPMDLQYMAGYYNSNGGGRHGFGGHNYGGQFGGYSNARWPWQVPLPPPLDSRRGGGAAVGPNESCTGSRGRHLQPSASSAYVWRRQQTTPPPPRISAEEQKKLGNYIPVFHFNIIGLCQILVPVPVPYLT